MSDEKTVYIDPDDDLTTVRESLDKIPSRKITLVVPSQTQLRSHVAWKLLYARARELNKEVLIVSSDPQVRSVAHAVKFRVAHSLESTSNSGRPKSGSRAGTGRTHSGTSRSRLTSPSSTTTAHATTAKESPSRRGGPPPSRTTRPPFSGQAPGWSELDSLLLPESPDSLPSRFDEPHTVKPNEPRPQRLNLPDRNGIREERKNQYDQIYDFRPETSPAIHPLPINQIEEPDLLIEDYNQAQDILQAATGSHPVVQDPVDAASTITSSGNTNMPMPETEAGPAPADQSPQPSSQVYGEDDPFIYMQDDSPPPSQSEQKGETILQDDEISQDFVLPQPSTISDLPTNVIESEVTYLGDDDAAVIQFPVSPSPIVQASSHEEAPFDEEDETTENRPSDLSPRPYGVPPWDAHADALPPPRQTLDDDEDQLPPLPEPSVSTQVPEPISLPVPRAPSRPLAPVSRPLPRTGGQMQQQAPAQRPGTEPRTRNGSRVSPSARSRRPAPQLIQSRQGSARPKSAVGTSTRRAATKTRSHGSRRLFLVLASVLALFVILFAVLYLSTSSTVQITVATRDYSRSVPLTLSSQKQTNAVLARTVQHVSTQTVSETATGTTMQGTNYAKGNVYFTNTSTASVQIPSQTVVATTSNVQFVTTANALILPQSSNPVPVPIQSVNQGVTGNVRAGSITVIPPDSLASIAQAQSPTVTPDNLKATLTVSNPDPTTGGEAHQVPAIAQQDLDKAKNDLNAQVEADINTWKQQIQQQNAKNGLFGQPVKNNPQINLPPTDTAEPDKTFSATISVMATMLVAQLNDAQNVAAQQLNNLLQADPNFGTKFAVIGGTVNIDPTQQSASNGNTLTVKVTGKAGPNLDRTDLQNSIKGKPVSEAQAILLKKNPSIKKVDIQALFGLVSLWADHIQVNILPAT